MADPGYLADMLHGAIFRSREVKTLMGLTGRVSWVLGVVSITTIYTAAPEFKTQHTVILIFCGTAWILLHGAAFILGMKFPDRFHYGAQEMLEIRRMERGDSLAGPVMPTQQRENR